jgi:hypothetical protein
MILAAVAALVIDKRESREYNKRASMNMVIWKCQQYFIYE